MFKNSQKHLNRRTSVVILATLLETFVGSTWSFADKPVATKNPTSGKSKILSSPRAVKAVAAQKVLLQPRIEDLGFHWGTPVFLRIFKQEKVLEIWLKRERQYALFAEYPICTYSGELGPKLQQGDGQAPEGFYSFKAGAMNPFSSYHLSFNIGYPNAYDRYHRRTGGAIMVHGNCVSIGCFAMTDPKIEEIYTLVEASFQNGQKAIPIHIFPFRPIPSALEQHSQLASYDFWQELAPGYSYFEEHRVPPDVRVIAGRYVIAPFH